MGEGTAPAAREPVRRGLHNAAAVLLALLAAGGCRTTEAPPQVGRTAERVETVAASGEARGDPVDAACRLAAWVVDDALGIEAESAEEPLSDLLAEEGEQGCRLTAVGSFADLPEDVETPVDLLWESFDEGGWHEDSRYAADTEVTSAVGMWKSGVLCVLGAVWTASEYEADVEASDAEDLRYDVMVECVPAEVPPIPLAGAIA